MIQTQYREERERGGYTNPNDKVKLTIIITMVGLKNGGLKSSTVADHTYKIIN